MPKRHVWGWSTLVSYSRIVGWHILVSFQFQDENQEHDSGHKIKVLIKKWDKDQKQVFTVETSTHYRDSL